MGSIKVLSAELAGRIAAGEVIERPASVVKELVENSIDAGATRIRVMAEKGGQRLIQVIDNGCGMDRQDALLCLEAHATSKITPDGDVGQIRTLGFRGEAMPSIASVTRFLLQTRPGVELGGTEVRVNYGAIEAVSDCGCAPGTLVKAEFLFGNLPARRKFLKGASTEDAQIEEAMLLLALSKPAIAFELFLNQRQVLRADGAQDIAARALMLLGRDAFEAMLPMDYREGDMHVCGFVSQPGYTRSNRREQRVVINGRGASADTVYYALRDAYADLVCKGRYPGAIVYIDLPPDQVDVNVHPAKREVRFRDPVRVSSLIAAAVRSSLRRLPGLISPTGATSVSAFGAAVTMPAMPAEVVLPPIQPGLPLPVPPARTERASDGRVAAVTASVPGSLSLPAESPREPESWSSPESSLPAGGAGLRLLGMLGRRYVLAEGENGVIVIDIRAAHQRILFERLLANLRRAQVPQQQLLIPVTLNLSPEEGKYLHGRLEQFKAMGFSLDHFGGSTYLLSAVPGNLPDENYAVVIRDVIDDLRHSPPGERQSTLSLVQAASRCAVRAETVLGADDQQRLLRDLVACEMPYTCPSGRPTMIHLTWNELARRFRQA